MCVLGSGLKHISFHQGPVSKSSIRETTVYFWACGLQGLGLKAIHFLEDMSGTRYSNSPHKLTRTMKGFSVI